MRDFLFVYSIVIEGVNYTKYLYFLSIMLI